MVVSAIDAVLMLTTFVAAAWWAVARSRLPVALGALSLGALGLAAVTLVAEGPHWQLVPWQLVATACAAAAALHWWRPGHSRRWSRVLGRLGLFAGVALGGVGLLFVRVPELPEPAGQYLVGSEVFRWTDPRRPEVLTA